MSGDNSKKSTIKSWYSNRYQIVLVQRNILLLFTLISMLSVAIAVIFVKTVMSSKSLEPYVIEIEEKTGIPTVVDQLGAQTFTSDQMVKKYFINQFIHLASGYDPKSYQKDIEKVRLMSSRAVYSDFKNRINPRDLGPNSQIEVRIKSVQFPSNSEAQVRLVKQTTTENSDSKMEDEVITIKFFFSPDMQLNMEERLINPLGFQVSSYVIAEEVFKY